MIYLENFNHEMYHSQSVMSELEWYQDLLLKVQQHKNDTFHSELDTLEVTFNDGEKVLQEWVRILSTRIAPHIIFRTSAVSVASFTNQNPQPWTLLLQLCYKVVLRVTQLSEAETQ